MISLNVHFMEDRKHMLFWKKTSIFWKLKTATVNQLDVECEWNSKVSKNYQNLGFFNEIYWFSEKKILKVSKNADGSKFVVECNWYSMISQKDQSLGYSKKQMVFLKTKLDFFETSWR